MHAWSEEGVKQVLGNICVFDHMGTTTLKQENTEIFSFWGWTFNPSLLSRSMTTIFFPEAAGRSVPDVSDAASPPERGEVELLIHLDQYFDWTPIRGRTPSSGASGLPSSTSSESGDDPFPFFKRFDLSRGVADGRPPAPRRMPDTCRRSPAGDRREDTTTTTTTEDRAVMTGGAASTLEGTQLRTCQRSSPFATAPAPRAQGMDDGMPSRVTRAAQAHHEARASHAPQSDVARATHSAGMMRVGSAAALDRQHAAQQATGLRHRNRVARLPVSTARSP